jgi:hypothetical protein
MKVIVRVGLGVIALAHYVVSFFLPTVDLSGVTLAGWEAFQVGWRAIVHFEAKELDSWILAAAWFANPLAWIAGFGLLSNARTGPKVLAWVAVLLGLPVFFRFGEVLIHGPGSWCWLWSIILLAVSATINGSSRQGK